MSTKVTRVRSRRDVRDFCRLPEVLHARDPRWVGPPSSDIRRFISDGHNPFHQEATIEHFLARDDIGTPVGRIAVVLHPAHMRRHGNKAFFGLFESIDDVNVAKALLAEVEAFAEQRGFCTVQGPCSYTMTQEAGLLVDGFEGPPVVLQPYNPPYYASLMKACGYDVAFSMSTFRVDRDVQSQTIAGVTERGRLAGERLGVTVRSLDPAHFDRDLAVIRCCYNIAFASHPETVAISPAVFSDQAGELKPVVDPRLLRIIEKGGRAVGFTVAVPNVYEILAPSRGRLTLGLLLQWGKRLRSIRSQVVIMIGAEPEASGDRAQSEAFGLGSCLSAEIARSLNEGWYDTVHTTWVHERNWQANMLMRAIGAQKSKQYAVFERSVA